MKDQLLDDYRELFSDPATRREYEEGRLLEEAVAGINGLLESLRLERRELADRLGVSKGRVTQLLSGDGNLTLRTLAAMAWALGYEFDLRLRPMADRVGTPAVADPEPPRWI